MTRRRRRGPRRAGQWRHGAVALGLETFAGVAWVVLVWWIRTTTWG